MTAQLIDGVAIARREAVREKATRITPVPGGVGPMTPTMLLVNTIQSAELALARARTAGAIEG